MEKKKYKHSFARRLTRAVMIVLFVMMGALAFLVYYLTRDILIDVNAHTYHANMQSNGRVITKAMSDLDAAVRNNLFDLEQHVDQPEQLQAIMGRMVELNPRLRSCGISFIENYFPKQGRACCPYATRNDSMQVETMMLKDTTYVSSDWFKEAVERDSAYWSEPFFDNRDDKTPLVAYMHPLHDKNGRVVGIIGADLSLDFMTLLLEKQDSAFQRDTWTISINGDGIFHSYVLSRDGNYITHKEQRRILKSNFYVHIKDVTKHGMAKEAIDEMKNGEKSDDETQKVLLINRTESYLFYAPLEGTNWLLAVSVPVIAIDLIGTGVGLMMFLLVGVILVITFYVCKLAIRRAAEPLKQLAATADEVANGEFNTPLPNIKSKDEIHMLRDSFENMQHSLANYVEELKTTTAQKATMESELKIAHDIQMSMVPKTYPAFPERQDLDIYGQVTPAKAVGGDLYDFFIRDDKLFFIIGDVSGKGVPASLVMAVTTSLFRNIATYTQEPNQIVYAINENLTANNETGMFVTLFVGMLDLTTGEIVYCNAGHNPPLLLANDEAEELEGEVNIAAGVIPDFEFINDHIKLNPGDTLFLFTDGLNEAENIDHEEYGMERVLKVANQTKREPQTLIEAMTQQVQLFVGEAEQSDDLTMLAIEYKKISNDESYD